MDIQHRTPEDYFNELIACIERANNQVKEFNRYATENAESSRADKAADFVDTYTNDFNDSLSGILATMGALNDNHLYQYEYDSVSFQVLDYDKVLSDLKTHREMYIARIKEATVFVPQGSLAVWVDDFEEMQDIAEDLEEKYDSIGIKY